MIVMDALQVKSYLHFLQKKEKKKEKFISKHC